MEYSVSARRLYIKQRLHTDWGWENYEKGPNGRSYRDIGREVQAAFKRDRLISPATIKRDIELLREQNAAPQHDLTEAQYLLNPNRFPEWRAALFTDPTTGDPYMTPKFQHAIFWIMYSVTKKVPMPQWVIEYINSVVPDDSYKLPENINDYILKRNHLLSFILMLAPRHGKTELVIHTKLFMFCEDQTTRILYGNGIKETSELMVGNVKSIMETNEKLIAWYGPFQRVGSQWSQKGIRLAGSDPQAKALSDKPYGVSSNVRSLDADSIFADDLQDYDRAVSETTTKRDFNWLSGELMTRRERHTGFVMVGSHLPVETGDLFSWVEDKKDDIVQGNHTMFMVKIPAHNYEKCDLENDLDEEGNPAHTTCVIWPELRDYGFLEAMRGLMGDDVMFEAVYNQIPRSKSMMHFPPDILRRDWTLPDFLEGKKQRPALPHDVEPGVLDRGRQWKDPDWVCCDQPVYVAMGFDPAAGKSKDASFTAAVVLGACGKCQRRYVIDYWYDRVSPETHPATIISFLRAYKPIRRLRIEINAYQAALARDPRLSTIYADFNVWIDEWDTNDRKWDDRLGIPQHARWFKNGLYSIPYAGAGDREYAEDYIRAFIRWPKTPDDLVMASWLADLSLMEMIEESRQSSAEIMPGSEQWMTPAHMENTFEIDLSDPELWEQEYHIL